MCINTPNQIFTGDITDWSGPASRIVKTSLRLGVPNFPGDTMTFTGEVTATDGRALTVTVLGKNARGTHVTADVTLEPVERVIA